MRPLSSRQVHQRDRRDNGRGVFALPSRHVRTRDLWLLCDFEHRLRKVLCPRCSWTFVFIRLDSWQCPRGIRHPARVQCFWRAAGQGPRHLRPHQVAVPRCGSAHLEYRHERGPDDRGRGALHGNCWILGEDHRAVESRQFEQNSFVSVHNYLEFGSFDYQWCIQCLHHHVIRRNCAKLVADSRGNVSSIYEGILVHGKRCSYLFWDCFRSCDRQNVVLNLLGQKPDVVGCLLQRRHCRCLRGRRVPQHRCNLCYCRRHGAGRGLDGHLGSFSVHCVRRGQVQ
jgi:hypothetical protein